MALLQSDLKDAAGLKLLSQGKVRDIYTIDADPEHLLFIASDRISAYDVILNNGIPDKGKLLTEVSLFWFNKLRDILPNHFVTSDINEMSPEIREHKVKLEGRTMLVKKAKVVPLEAIVRGYITGSAWSEYKKSGTVHGIAMPTGLQESQEFPEPIFTPSTKADQGEHDENISPEKAAEIVGKELYDKISSVSIKLYTAASTYARSRGIILADTKFEFGLINGDELILVDEVLTPDSSRYWPLEGYAHGKSQPSFDKQYLRDWLVSAGFKKGLEGGLDGKSGWTIDEEVVEGTRQRYEDVVKKLTSQS